MEEIKIPVYRKIALDIATRIYAGEFKEGNKIHGRSTLASKYQVSPETIRKAISLLEDMGVVAVTKGSGIYITSQLNASRFIEKFRSKESFQMFKVQLKDLMTEKANIDNKINDLLFKIIDYTDRFKSIYALEPMEIEITNDSHLINKTISESKFWQHTGATIIGIRRNEDLIISPGPYTDFRAGDKILFVGDLEVLERIRKYILE